MNRLRAIRISVGLVAALCLASVTGCAGKNSTGNIFGQDANQKAYEKMLERQQARASDELAAAKKLPAMTDADYERLGDSYFQQGNMEMAYLQYVKVLRKKSDNPQVLYKVGALFLARGLNQDAMQYFQAILAKDSGNALAHQGMGQVLFKEKNYPEAEKHFQAAVKSNPKLWTSYNYLGIMYDYQQRSDLAVDQYKAAIAQMPDDHNLYNNLGVSYSLIGRHDEAIDAFRRGLRTRTGQKDAKLSNNLGIVLCKAGRFQEALDAFRNAGDEAQAHNNLGSFYLQAGDYDAAIRSFERAVQLRGSYYAQASENLRKAQMALQAQSSSFSRPSNRAKPSPAGSSPAVKSGVPILEPQSTEPSIREQDLPGQSQTGPSGVN
jgi:tetratricopeptide (TPR) repeat protein